MDLKFPYLGPSRFLYSQQRGPDHLGLTPQGNMQRTIPVDTSPADTMLPKATIVALKGLLARSNFISALDTGVKAHCVILLRMRNDLVFHQLIVSE